MKKKIILVAICLMLMTTTIVSAAKPKPVQQIDLVQKNTTTWEIIEGGAWGKLIINENNNLFVFNAHLLNPGDEWVLVNWPESWPNAPFIGSGVVNDEGNLHIMGDMPSLTFVTYTYGEYAGQTGAKIWLIHAHDYNFATQQIYGWSPVGWLFETSLLV
jgi:hypothetical protein